MDFYCLNLNLYNQLKNDFINTSFNKDIPGCSREIELSLSKATRLYNTTKNNPDFIEEMKKGCAIGGYQTACHISKSNANDIVNQFYCSYDNYLINPNILCISFSEFSNNLEKLFITGGCYLDNKKSFQHICNKKYKCS